MVKVILNERAILAQHSVMLLLSYLTLFIVNAAVLYLANLIFPSAVVLGTFTLTPFWALMLSASKLTLLGTAVIPLVYYYEWKSRRNFKNHEWMLLYFVANVVFIYFTTRFAEIYGLGVSSIFVVLALALVLDFVQGIAMMSLGKVKIK